jgi:hypothetical protein
MSNGGAAAAAAAASARAIKASGTIVKLEPGELERLLARQPGLLVVTAQGDLTLIHEKTKPHTITSLDAATALWFQVVAHCRGASEFNRSAS